ncbi:hypothetical protein [Erythrobacter litoralis]|uniref:Uncharacterized protein n=1 Tax=Erythrobacter litoralis (strain HTCC2594) TaxID=314225 RepID=Q2N9H5_ERYLH|nr:hypothetical protein [Erythrobacter litoralis]ABC63666.1 hypothetical protein ELI_07870 [Erythrobacter litoralis HTCC2594]
MDPRPDCDPDTTHPVILWNDLHAEDPCAPQTQFVPDRQIAFLEALATTGSVRQAARRARVSHQTCYRARRNSAAFGRAWDAALVIARGRAEAELADCALNGRREEVWYHGEMVGYRTRHSDRLLLAHLGRLDRMRTDERIERLAEGFDDMLGRMRAAALEAVPVEGVIDVSLESEGDPAPTSVRTEPVSLGDSCASEVQAPRSHQATLVGAAPPLRVRQAQHERSEGDERGSGDAQGDDTFFAPGQWSKRSMSEGEGEGEDAQHCEPVEPPAPCATCGGACNGPVAALTQDDCMWFGHRLDRMLAALPEGVERYPHGVGRHETGIDEVRIDAFECGLDEWWLVTTEEELEARMMGDTAMPETAADGAREETSREDGEDRAPDNA